MLKVRIRIGSIAVCHYPVSPTIAKALGPVRAPNRDNRGYNDARRDQRAGIECAHSCVPDQEISDGSREQSVVDER